MGLNISKEDFEKYNETLAKIKEEEKSIYELKNYKSNFEETLIDNVGQMVETILAEAMNIELYKILGDRVNEELFKYLNIRQTGLPSFYCDVIKIIKIKEDEVVFGVQQYATHGEYDYGELYVPIKVINECADRNYVLDVIESFKKEKEEQNYYFACIYMAKTEEYNRRFTSHRSPSDPTRASFKDLYWWDASNIYASMIEKSLPIHRLILFDEIQKHKDYNAQMWVDEFYRLEKINSCKYC